MKLESSWEDGKCTLSKTVKGLKAKCNLDHSCTLQLGSFSAVGAKLFQASNSSGFWPVVLRVRKLRRCLCFVVKVADSSFSCCESAGADPSAIPPASESPASSSISCTIQSFLSNLGKYQQSVRLSALSVSAFCIVQASRGSHTAA